MREMVSELFCRGSFDCALLYAHAWGIGASELEGGELGCRVLPVVDGKLRQP